MDDYVGRVMFFAGDYDGKLSWILRRTIGADDVFYDIGADFLLYTMLASTRIGPNGAAHCFEPNPRLAPYLDETLGRLSQSNVRLHKVAVGEMAETLTLSEPEGNAGSASLTSLGDQTAQQVDVPVIVLSDYVEAEEMPPPTVIKIDVENFEAQVIAGGARLFRSAPSKLILLEEHNVRPGADLPRSIDLLRELGYELFGIRKKLIGAPSFAPLDTDDFYKCWDFAALHPETGSGLRSVLGM